MSWNVFFVRRCMGASESVLAAVWIIMFESLRHETAVLCLIKCLINVTEDCIIHT